MTRDSGLKEFRQRLQTENPEAAWHLRRGPSSTADALAMLDRVCDAWVRHAGCEQDLLAEKELGSYTERLARITECPPEKLKALIGGVVLAAGAADLALHEGWLHTAHAADAVTHAATAVDAATHTADLFCDLVGAGVFIGASLAVRKLFQHYNGKRREEIAGIAQRAYLKAVLARAAMSSGQTETGAAALQALNGSGGEA